MSISHLPHLAKMSQEQPSTTPLVIAATAQRQECFCSAIHDSQQRISPIGFLFLKLPPPPRAVLLVYVWYYWWTWTWCFALSLRLHEGRGQTSAFSVSCLGILFCTLLTSFADFTCANAASLPSKVTIFSLLLRERYLRYQPQKIARMTSPSKRRPRSHSCLSKNLREGLGHLRSSDFVFSDAPTEATIAQVTNCSCGPRCLMLSEVFAFHLGFLSFTQGSVWTSLTDYRVQSCNTALAYPKVRGPWTSKS